MSKVPDFMSKLSKALGPWVLVVHNVSGGPMSVHVGGNLVEVKEFTLVNGSLLGTELAEPIRSWNTHERNVEFLRKLKEDLTSGYQDYMLVCTVRETVEPAKDGRGVLKRPKVWKCGLEMVYAS